MNQSWKLVLALVGIFAAGVITGAFVTLRVGRAMMANRPMPEQWAPQRLKQLAERLELNPEQLEQIRPIMKRNMEELNRLRSYSMTETRSVFERLQREITEKLTPEQRVKFEQFNKEMRERSRRNNERQGGPGGPSGPRSDRDRPMGEPGKPPGPKPPPPPDKPPGN